MNDHTALYVAHTIHTLDAQAPIDSTGILVVNGLIAEVGNAAALRRAAPSETQIHDFGSATITPGLIDGHSHPIVGLEWTRGEDLSACTTLAEVIGKLQDARYALEPGAWLRGWGLNPHVFQGSAPSHHPLRDVFEGIPAYVLLYDGHSAIVSSTALEMTGVTGERNFASDARIVTDSNGTPTGHVLELEALELFTTLMPSPSLESRAHALLALLSDMARTGLVGAHVMDSESDALEILEMAEKVGELPVHLDLNAWVVPSRAHDLTKILSLHGRHGRRWRVEGVKFFLDGTVDGGTAWLEQEDCCGRGTGTPWGNAKAFAAVFEQAYLAGVNTATHAIGDRAVRTIYELVTTLERRHGPRGAHRIEHIETVPDSVVSLFSDQIVAASMQPLHATRFARADHSDSWSQRLGEERAANGFRCRDIRDAGATLALGSDWPIAPFDPRIIMADAMLRRPFDDPTTDPVGPHQALTAIQALEGFTTHAARASGEDRQRGAISPGLRADFTVWGQDPLATPADSLGTSRIISTVVHGRPVAL